VSLAFLVLGPVNDVADMALLSLQLLLNVDAEGAGRRARGAGRRRNWEASWREARKIRAADVVADSRIHLTLGSQDKRVHPSCLD